MAQILDKMNINDVATFDVYPSALLGTQFRQCTVLAIWDFETTRAMGFDPAAMHVKVFDTLPAGTPNDPTKYTWLKIKLISGETTAIGVPWIKADTIQVVTTSTITVVYTNVSPDDVAKIRIMNANNGYNTFSIDIK
jgi:hypothetical protein